MKQVLIIHGGNSFSSYEVYRKYLDEKVLDYEKMKVHTGWQQWLAAKLTDADVLLPTMPNSLNAVYDEWKVYFEKLVPLLQDDVRLIGHSLGAMFLAKYLNENVLEKPVRQLVLLAGGYDDESNEDLGSFKVESAVNVPKSAQQVYLFHSTDDPVVPYAELAKFRRDMPNATVRTFTDKGHFFAMNPTFPELLDILKQK